MKKAIVVLGMHRSGTSSVAGALTHLGAAPPATLLISDRDNPRGFWESQRVIEIDDRLLQASGSYWRDWRRYDASIAPAGLTAELKAEMAEVLRSEFGDASMIVLKEPRMCRLWAQWDPVVAAAGYDARFVLPVRSPLEVAGSLHRRNQMPIAEGLLLWLRHVLDAERATRGRPRRVLRWDRFMADWRAEADRIEAALGLALPDRGEAASATVDDFLSIDLKTVQASKRALTDGPDAHLWISAAYDALTDLTRQDDDPKALAVLDDLGRRFDEASDLFGRSVGALLGDVEAAEFARDRAVREIDRAEQIAERLGRNLIRASQRYEALAARLDDETLARATDGARWSEALDHETLARREAEAQGELARQAHDREATLRKEAEVQGDLARQARDREATLRREAEALIETLEADLAAGLVRAEEATAAADSVRRARDVLAERISRIEAEAAVQARAAAGRQALSDREFADATARLAEARATTTDLQSRLEMERAQRAAFDQALVERPFATAWAAWLPRARRRLAVLTRRLRGRMS